MTVYVDDLQVWPHARGRFKAGSCHMTADTLAELHEFARRIGIKRHWFHRTKLAPHYDLIEVERAAALAAAPNTSRRWNRRGAAEQPARRFRPSSLRGRR